MADERDLNISDCDMQTVIDRLLDRMEILSATDEELQMRCDAFMKESANNGQLEDVISPEDLRTAAQLPMLLIGKPGVGKTMIVLNTISGWNKRKDESKHFGFKKIVLSTTEVGSMQGIPMVVNGEAKRIPVSDFPIEERDGKCGILFLDEITTADTQQVQPILPLCDSSRNLGEYQLPPCWLVVAAGNRPDDANFVEMKDMTLSRFEAFNVETNYQRDWRKYARSTGVDPMIIAFLNFSPDMFIKVVTDIDSDPEVGKQFSTARTWEALSKNLKSRKIMGKPVTQSEMYNFASRFIGSTAAREFAAFCNFRTMIKANPKKILEGKEEAAKDILVDSSGTFSFSEQEYHILLQGLISGLKVLVESTHDYENNIHGDAGVIALKNVLEWVIPISDFMLEYVVNSIVEMRNEIPLIQQLLNDADFSARVCPLYEEFIMEHAESFDLIDLDDL